MSWLEMYRNFDEAFVSKQISMCKFARGQTILDVYVYRIKRMNSFLSKLADIGITFKIFQK